MQYHPHLFAAMDMWFIATPSARRYGELYSGPVEQLVFSPPTDGVLAWIGKGDSAKYRNPGQMRAAGRPLLL